MNMLLWTYRDMMFSAKMGNSRGQSAVSKPIYLLSIMEAIEYCYLLANKIGIGNEFIRKRFGQLYEQYYNNNKGFEVQFFIRPFFHLNSSEFYHLIWNSEHRPPLKSHTPSEKYLREYLLYAKLDDELWDILQDAVSREYLRRNIITRFLTKQ